MANINAFRSSDDKIRPVFQVLHLLCLTLLVPKISCTPNSFTIGGSKGWSVPDDPSAPHYNQWAEKNRFEIGDSIVFAYPADKDSVLLVNQDDYTNCNTDHPLQKFEGGHTVYKFEKSGPHYFISGNKENCQKNEKVVVVVLAERSNRTASPAPTPSPSTNTPPSPAPAFQGSPSPSPPPPSGTVEINPVPSPVSEPAPPSGAASVHMSLLGCIGALAAASSLVF